jgi:pimeloyl-ACP methyl ester carboxylesterase
MRIWAKTWPFPFGVRLGWATARTRNPDAAQALAHVYCLRGLATYSPGFGRLVRTLRLAGAWAEDLRCVGDLWVRKRLIANHVAKRQHGPVVLVGHSCGGRYALYSAQRLAELGIPIDLLICLDVAMPYAVAPNVARAVHLYFGGPRIYPARPIQACPGASPLIENIDLRQSGSPVDGRGLNHLNITSDPGVHRWVVGQILSTVLAKTAERSK